MRIPIVGDLAVRTVVQAGLIVGGMVALDKLERRLAGVAAAVAATPQRDTGPEAP